MRLDRRKALQLLGFTAASPALATAIEAKPRDHPGAFRHGVASGDPSTDGFVIWTRVTPKPGTARAVEVAWSVAEDAAFRRPVAKGVAQASAARDHTVKVEVAGGLKPATDYWYRFTLGRERSPVGRARTLPEGPTADAVLAFACCANYQVGFFNAYRAIAGLPRVDAVVHLGDYIYEDAADAKPSAKRLGDRLQRFIQPRNELVTLADYRARHALYKTDPDLQTAHAAAPWICVWDDHESANDCWLGGAVDHHPDTEGPWSARKAAAIRAYYEWMPIREPKPGQAFEAINRSFQFGDLASLIMLETRLIARAHQLRYQADMRFRPDPDSGSPRPDWAAFKAKLDDPARQMMGAKQEAWLAAELDSSVAAGRPWQVLGNQVVMARVKAPDVKAMLGPVVCDAVLALLPPDQRERAQCMADILPYGPPYNLDSWDGYPAARERVYAALKAAGARPIVVSGDSHAFWANDLIDAGGERVGAEIGVTSVTSPGACDEIPAIPINRLIEGANPDVHFTDHAAKGFVRLTLTREAATAELIAVSTIHDRDFESRALQTYRVAAEPGGGLGALVQA